MDGVNARCISTSNLQCNRQLICRLIRAVFIRELDLPLPGEIITIFLKHQNVVRVARLQCELIPQLKFLIEIDVRKLDVRRETELQSVVREMIPASRVDVHDARHADKRVAVAFRIRVIQCESS